MDYKERILLKVTSGRFLVAVILSIAFGYLSIIGKITSEFTNIYMIVITFYFSKDRMTYNSTSPNGTTSISQEGNSTSNVDVESK